MTVCCYCERTIKSNQSAIECLKCCSWVHKGCTGLPTTEFDKICALHKKTGSHSWECKSCKKNEVKRLSIGISNSRSVDQADFQLNSRLLDRQNSVSASTPVMQSTTSATEKSEVKLKSQIANLLKKTSTTNKDVLFVLASVVDLLMDQKGELQVALDEIRDTQQMKCERIEHLETKVAELQQEIIELKAGTVYRTDGQNILGATGEVLPSHHCDMFKELQERNNRAKNIMIYNMSESSSDVASLRVDHDKEQVLNMFKKIGLKSDIEFKVLRIGRLGTNSRPTKVILPDSEVALECIKNRHKLGSSCIRIKSDLTLLQRKQLKCLYEELDRRKQEGEPDLAIRYKNGVPSISKILPPRSNAQKHDVPKNC